MGVKIMSSYYCPKCTRALLKGKIVDTTLCNLSGSFSGDYLEKKYYKYVLNIGTYTVNSIFTHNDCDTNSTISYKEYENYCLLTSVSGSLEIDDHFRYNLLFYAINPIGVLTVSGIPISSLDCVKLVLFQQNNKIHAYPTSSTDIISQQCAYCGNLIL